MDLDTWLMKEGWVVGFVESLRFPFFRVPNCARLNCLRVLVRVKDLVPSSSINPSSSSALLVWVMTSLMCFGREVAQGGVIVTFGFWQHSIVYKSSCVLLKHCSLQLFDRYLAALLLWLANLPVVYSPHHADNESRNACPFFFFFFGFVLSFFSQL